MLLETFNLYFFNLHEFNFEWKEDSDSDCLKQHSWSYISSFFNDMSPWFQNKSSDVGTEVAKVL